MKLYYKEEGNRCKYQKHPHTPVCILLHRRRWVDQKNVEPPEKKIPDFKTTVFQHKWIDLFFCMGTDLFVRCRVWKGITVGCTVFPVCLPLPCSKSSLPHITWKLFGGHQSPTPRSAPRQLVPAWICSRSPWSFFVCNPAQCKGCRVGLRAHICFPGFVRFLLKSCFSPLGFVIKAIHSIFSLFWFPRGNHSLPISRPPPPRIQVGCSSQQSHNPHPARLPTARKRSIPILDGRKAFSNTRQCAEGGNNVLKSQIGTFFAQTWYKMDREALWYRKKVDS